MEHKKEVTCSFCGNSLKRYPTKTDTFFCDKTCKGKWQILQREKKGFTKEWLIDQYINKGKSSNQIAKEIKRDPKSVWTWLRDYGIKIRPRGTDYGQLIKKGHASYFKGHKHTEENKEKMRQARLKDGHVPYLKNGKHWLHETGRHPGSWKGGITPERQAVYSSLEWKESIKTVWERDNAICQRCGKQHNTTKNRGTFHIHHIVSFMVKKLRTEPSNLILLCAECHKWVHGKENVNKQFLKEI